MWVVSQAQLACRLFFNSKFLLVSFDLQGLLLLAIVVLSTSVFITFTRKLKGGSSIRSVSLHEPVSESLVSNSHQPVFTVPHFLSLDSVNAFQRLVNPSLFMAVSILGLRILDYVASKRK